MSSTDKPILADFIVKNVQIIDGTGQPAFTGELAVQGQRIVAIGEHADVNSKQVIDGEGLTLAPGFIDVHTHDDVEVIRNPGMFNKVSQGVTTVIVGNCGISATPFISSSDTLPDPINLLGTADELRFAEFADYADSVAAANPAVNVAALVGHTALRAQTMTDLQQGATADQIQQMKALLKTALDQGAIGLSTGLAYANAKAAPSSEVETLAELLPKYGAVYSTHLRTEFTGIIGALDEAFAVGAKHKVPVVISHIKCAGKQNWGRSKEVLAHLDAAKNHQHIGCDCYPYSASSSTLDLKQVTDEFDILITWSKPHPEVAGTLLADIAKQWQMSLLDAAKQLQPAGAVYHGMDEQDVRNFISYADSMIGSDGLPCDPTPHPRLWGSFPRVLGHYVRETKLLKLEKAVHKMTGLSAAEFKFKHRGTLAVGHYADLVLFDPSTIKDLATFSEPTQASQGIIKVWVNGTLTLNRRKTLPVLTGERSGQLIKSNYSTQ